MFVFVIFFRVVWKVFIKVGGSLWINFIVLVIIIVVGFLVIVLGIFKWWVIGFRVVNSLFVV